MEAREIDYENVNFTFSILRISTTLHHTYQLLYYTGQIKMTSNYSTIEVEAEKIEYKNETTHSIYLGFLLYYITLTYYYILAYTFR